MKLFFIYSLPRSRTAWLANFLTYGESYCFHEGLVEAGGVRQLKALMENVDRPIVGNSDCGNVLFADELLATFPDATHIVILRDTYDVAASFKRSFGFDINVPKLNQFVLKLTDMTLGMRNVSAYRFSEICPETIWKKIFGRDMDDVQRRRMVQLNRTKLELIPELEMAYINTYQVNVLNMAREA